VSAVLSSREVLGVFQPGDHGSTFGGNPLACAIARAALKVIVDERLADRSGELGAFAMDYLRKLRSPHVVEIRGKGLWIGVQLNTAARPFCEALKHLGVLCKETHESVIRLAPPLVIGKDDLEWGLEQVGDVLRPEGATAARHGAEIAEAAVAS
jgi:ornithine--oxo-acid transaminase